MEIKELKPGESLTILTDEGNVHISAQDNATTVRYDAWDVSEDDNGVVTLRCDESNDAGED